MAGEHIALLRLLRLRNALKATVTSKEFVDLKVFKSASDIILCDDFWKYLFMMCRALYAPMRVLRLADQKSPAMDKLYFYVLQADAMLPKYLGDLDKHSNGFLSSTTIASMTSVPSAGRTVIQRIMMTVVMMEMKMKSTMIVKVTMRMKLG